MVGFSGFDQATGAHGAAIRNLGCRIHRRSKYRRGAA
jgi:hypothetical protein